MEIQQYIMTQNDCYKQGKKIVPQMIMVHSVGSKGTMFKSRWWPAWNKPDVSKCVHYFIDTEGIYQCLPNGYRGWHGASGPKGSANDLAVGFEICEPKNDTPENRDDLYAKTVWLCKYLCDLYGLTADDIITHCEGHQMGIASNHADVNHWWGKGVWAGYTMDRLREDVRKSVPLTGWQKGEDGRWRFYNAEGKLLYSRWFKDGNFWYYLMADGTMAVGWAKVGTKWYYLKPDSPNQGSMMEGWLKLDGKTYYLTPGEGDMATGTAVIDGESYIFNESGELVAGG